MSTLPAQLSSHSQGRAANSPEAASLNALAALAQRTRLTVFRLLVAQEPDGMAAGSIALEIGAPQNTVSAHLGVLARAGLVSATRQHRNIIYRANLERMQVLIDYLISNCCEGEPTCTVSDVSAECDGRQAK